MVVCLVVDDEEDHNEIGKILCRGLGMDVHGASNGEEALEFCKQQLPDLILLDWMMPKMDGLEFLKHLRSLPNGTRPYVMMCSARGENEAIEVAMNKGADSYLAKPFNPPELLEKVIKTKVLG